MLFENFEHEYAQLKLTSGHEIVCEVIEWPEEEDYEIVARNVLSIVIIEQDGERRYTFRPFLQYCETNDELVIININHVMSINRPNFLLINDYKLACAHMHESMNARYKHFERERQKEILKKNLPSDSDQVPKKVLKFPNTFH